MDFTPGSNVHIVKEAEANIIDSASGVVRLADSFLMNNPPDSRFLIRYTSFEYDTKELHLEAQKALETLDTVIVSEDTKSKFAASLQDRIDVVRGIVVDDIAPILMGTYQGWLEGVETIKQITGLEDNQLTILTSSLYTVYEKAIEKAAKVVLVQKAALALNLNRELTTKLINSAMFSVTTNTQTSPTGSSHTVDHTQKPHTS